MASATFRLRDLKAKGKTAIQCKLHYSGNEITIRTKQSVEPKYWNNSSKKIKSSYGKLESAELNDELKKIAKTAESEVLKFTKTNDREPTPQEIKKIVEVELFGGAEKDSIPKDFYGYWNYFVGQQRNAINPKTGRKVTKSTIRGYENTLTKIKAFEKSTKIAVSFENIDLDFYFSFKEYLEGKNYSFNTIGKHIKVLKTILNDATSSGVNRNLKFRSKKFIILKEETTEIYLNEFELNEIEKLDLTANKRLEKARDQFLLLCWTGQRYQSLNDIVNPNNRNDQFISLKQSKTDQRVMIPILPPVRKVFDKYDKIETLSNVRLNAYIKEVCKLVPALKKKTDVTSTKGGINRMVKKPIYELVSTHTGRRSFATNFYNRKEFSINEIMSITGHKKESTFYAYIRSTPEENAQRFLNTFNKIERSNTKLKSV